MNKIKYRPNRGTGWSDSEDYASDVFLCVTPREQTSRIRGIRMTEEDEKFIIKDADYSLRVYRGSPWFEVEGTWFAVAGTSVFVGKAAWEFWRKTANTPMTYYNDTGIRLVEVIHEDE